MTGSRLILAGVVLIGGMTIIVPLLTGWWPGDLAGYFTVLGIYWFGWCLPVAIAAHRRAGWSTLTLKLRGALWVPAAVLAFPAFVAVYAFATGRLDTTPAILGAGFAAALVNAPLEEVAWRGSYLALGPSNPAFQTVGVWLFALWHAPLTLAVGVEFGLTAVSLVTVTFMLGAFWAFVAWRTRGVGWPIVGHVALNAVAFPVLISANV
ncbi:type II CAAX prenyl endopeptidase Rce1 family protein [Acuticoccus sp.]|uniref:CPBP family glutamic-type intramembrane protease n=1 Tax=Acuticoccus sp. TaxID=1904378 RepID=UPI003B523278